LLCIKKLVKDLLKSSLAFGTTESNLVQMAFGTIGLREWSLFMWRGGGKWEGEGKRSFTVINRGVKKVLT
jgi:hypothetical protein